MKIVYTGQEIPKEFTKSIFLAGPSPRSKEIESWRPEALRILEELKYDGVVYVPEWEDGPKGESDFDYEGQVNWEEKAMSFSDMILFWVPRNMETMPALTTNHEHGEWFRSGKIMLGYPSDAVKMEYLDYKARSAGVYIYNSLKEMLWSCVEYLGDGILRSEGDRYIPIFIWRKIDFKDWYQEVIINQNNVIEGATLEWNFKFIKKHPSKM